MNRVNLVSLDVLVGEIEGIDNAKLLKEIEDHAENIGHIFIANKNHTYYEDKKFPFGQQESDKFISALNQAVCSALQIEMEMEAIWTVTLSKGNSVSMHSHRSNLHMRPSEYFSIAYYVNAPEGSADLIFEADYCGAIETHTMVKPESGMLIIFNSFIKHMTHRHNAEENGVVISANFAPVNPDTTPTQDWSAYKPKPKNTLAVYWIYAKSPLGTEEYKLTLHNDGKATIATHKESIVVDSYKKSGSRVILEFDVATPMMARVLIDFYINIKSELSGFALINEYSRVYVSGFQEM